MCKITVLVWGVELYYKWMRAKICHCDTKYSTTSICIRIINKIYNNYYNRLHRQNSDCSARVKHTHNTIDCVIVPYEKKVLFLNQIRKRISNQQKFEEKRNKNFKVKNQDTITK